MAATKEAKKKPPRVRLKEDGFDKSSRCVS